MPLSVVAVTASRKIGFQLPCDRVAPGRIRPQRDALPVDPSTLPPVSKGAYDIWASAKDRHGFLPVGATPRSLHSAAGSRSHGLTPRPGPRPAHASGGSR